MDIDPARHRSRKSNPAGPAAESQAARPGQQPTDAGLADPAADLQYGKIIEDIDAMRWRYQRDWSKTLPSKKDTFMKEDGRDFLERSDSTMRNLYGVPGSIDQIADQFALYDLRKRAAALENFDAELRGEIGSGSHSLRRHAELMTLRRKLGDVHEALRKARR
jgi:hypothetical protein